MGNHSVYLCAIDNHSFWLCEVIAICYRYVPKYCLYSFVLYLIYRIGCLKVTVIATMVVYDGFDLRSDKTT